MNKIEELLLENKAWAQERTDENADYFKHLSEGQHPEFLWIGCSDSRVPISEITNTHPGDVFVHRNVANLVVHTDFNLMSVLQYAVEQLKVKHIILCGHTGCGGVAAAAGHHHFGLINKWIRQIKDIYRIHRDEIDSIDNEHDRLNKLVELNVIEQTHNLSRTSIVQRAWGTDNIPTLHGWIFDIETGLIDTVIDIHPNDEIDPIYKFDGFEAH